MAIFIAIEFSKYLQKFFKKVVKFAVFSLAFFLGFLLDEYRSRKSIVFGQFFV